MELKSLFILLALSFLKELSSLILGTGPEDVCSGMKPFAITQ